MIVTAMKIFLTLQRRATFQNVQFFHADRYATFQNV